MSPLWTTALHAAAIAASTVLLWKGADWLVDGASSLARRFKVSELVIGLTLVALGTSAPEFAVSIGAALSGQADISVANVVGSNIFNLGFILGGCAAIRPILTSRPLVYRDGVVLIGITVLLAIFLADLRLERWEGALMVVGLAAYLGVLWWRRSALVEEGDVGRDPPRAAEAASEGGALAALGLFLVGLVIVVGASRLLVYGAAGMARAFGLSDWTIGVTIVAAGTSAPELVTSLAAALKGKHGISAGGLIGSDIFNLLGVLGVAGAIRPLDIAETGRGSVLMLVGMVLVVFVFMRSGWRLSRLEGVILLTIGVLRWWADMSDGDPLNLIR